MDNLESRLIRIQQSTRTLFPFFIRVHDWCRSHSRLYYQWHTFPFASGVHWVAVVAWIVIVGSVVTSSFFIPSPHTSSAADPTSYDLATVGNFNVRFDAATAGDVMTKAGYGTGDINNNGSPDLIIYSSGAGFNGRATSGSIYVIYDTLLSTFAGTGQTVDLSDSSKYNLRFDGPAANSSDTSGSRLSLNTGDLNDDGKDDITLNFPTADNNSRVNSGSVYVVYGDLLAGYSGTGNNIDLAISTNYNLRLDGALANDIFGWSGMPVLHDIDNDGKKDLTIGAWAGDFNSRSSSGSLYVFFQSFLSTFSGTGNDIDVASASNFNIRYDGPVTNGFLGYAQTQADLNSDGQFDLIITDDNATNNGISRSGSVYVIYSTSLIPYANTTGNILDLAVGANYNLRYDGEAIDQRLGSEGNLAVVDADSNGKNDLLIGSFHADNNARTDSGSVWLIYDSLITPITGTGNTINLATNTNYNLRIDGAFAGESLGTFGPSGGALFNNGKTQLLLSGWQASYNSRSNSGSLYLIDNPVIASYSGTGNTLDLSDSSKYSVRYDSAASGDTMITSRYIPVDLNGDSTLDLLASSYKADNNARADSGSLYVIYNFPHTISVAAGSATTETAAVSVTGTVSATGSTTTISGIQYSIDTATFAGTWSTCAATDGTFNSTSEEFRCDATLPSTGAHTIRVRAVDGNGSYTPVSRYATQQITYTIPAAATSTATPTPVPTVGTAATNTKAPSPTKTPSGSVSTASTSPTGSPSPLGETPAPPFSPHSRFSPLLRPSPLLPTIVRGAFVVVLIIPALVFILWLIYEEIHSRRKREKSTMIDESLCVSDDEVKQIREKN